MPRVWYATPSARPVQQAQVCFDAWRGMGYAVAATRKNPDLALDYLLCLPKYPGLWAAINILARDILAFDPQCQIVVTCGDDVFPDPIKRADEVAAEFVEHFGGTLGVMQPTGGKPWSQGVDERGRRVTERNAWSPWLGREWCLRAYGGQGPTWAGFWHYHGDTFLQLTAERLGLFWQRPDLRQEHRTWKTHEGNVRPPHLVKPRDRWADDKALFDEVSALDWPGARLLEDAA